MRITALSGVLAFGVLGGLATSAHADRNKPLAASRQLAALVDPAKQPAPTLSRGELGLTATTHLVRPAQPDGQATVAATTPPARLERRSREDQDDRRERKALERYLTTGDVSEVVAQRGAEIEHCYIDALGASRRGGRLDLMFIIARDGHVVSLDSAAPGVPVVAAHQLHKCLRGAVEALQFPVRRNDTTAIVPYYFQRTDAPNAGPQLSCWNPRGC